MDADAAMDAQTAPTAAWKSRQEREIPTASTAHSFFWFFRSRSRADDGRSRSAVSGDR